MYNYDNGTAGLWVFPGTPSQGDGSAKPYRVWFEGHQGWWDWNRTKLT